MTSATRVLESNLEAHSAEDSGFSQVTPGSHSPPSGVPIMTPTLRPSRCLPRNHSSCRVERGDLSAPYRLTIVDDRLGSDRNLYSTHKSPASPLYQQSATPPTYGLWFFIRYTPHGNSRWMAWMKRFSGPELIMPSRFWSWEDGQAGEPALGGVTRRSGPWPAAWLRAWQQKPAPSPRLWRPW